MNAYKPRTPRAACGVAAIVMTALTFAMFVGLPAVIGSGYEESHAVTASPSVAASASTPVVPPEPRAIAASVHSNLAEDCEATTALQARDNARQTEKRG